MACLQENVSVGMKRVKANVFIQDPFNPVLLPEDAERYVHVSNIVCALTCYNYREDTLQLEQHDLILLLDVLHHTNKVVTVAESVQMTETAVDEVQHERIRRRRKRRFESDFFCYESKGKTSKQIWGTTINIFGDQGKRAKMFGIKGT